MAVINAVISDSFMDKNIKNSVRETIGGIIYKSLNIEVNYQALLFICFFVFNNKDILC